MKLIIIILSLTSILLSYDKGDTINPDIVTRLGLEGNKVYVIDFFASWCSSCKKEIPLISKANTKINESEAQIIGIDVDKDPKKGKKFQKTLQANGDLNFKVINDPQNSIISEFNPKGMPTLFYIKNQKIFKITTGAVPNIDKEILITIKQHLN